MSERQKIVSLILALFCNFTFLLTAEVKANQLPDQAACKHPFGTDSLETLKYISLLKDDFKMKDYDMAYQDLRYLLTHAPCAYKGTYVMGPSILSALINKPQYAARKQKLLDTLFAMYPKRIDYFGEEGVVKARWAYSISKFKPTNYKEALVLYARYIELEQNKIEDVLYIKDYMQQGLLAYKNKTWTKTQTSELFSSLESICIKHQIKYFSDTAKSNEWLTAEDYLLLKSKPILNCKDWSFPTGSIGQAKPSDTMLVLVSSALKIIETIGLPCTNTANYLELLKSSFESKPSSRKAISLANYYERKKDVSMMNQYYLSAVELSSDKKTQENLYTLMAKKNTKDLDVAKIYADKALFLNPDNGICLIICGLYVYHKRCGDVFEQAMSASAAVDYFNKAMKADATAVKEAKLQIAKYQKLFPLKSDAFFRGLKPGNLYTIKCLGITTEVRTRS